MSSRTGLKRADGQRLGPLLAALCGPVTPVLRIAAGRPYPVVRSTIDIAFDVLGGAKVKGVESRDLEIEGLPARLHTPAGAGDDAPLLVFIHGGGWVFGSLKSHQKTARLTALETGCKVLCLSYRKAPETPFPGPLDDCVRATRWALAHAADLGVDPARVAVGGDSAGATLAAGVCLALAGDARRPRAAWLLYPIADADLDAWPSGQLFAKGPMISAAAAKVLVDQHAPNPEQKSDPRLSLVHSGELDRMPPTYVATAGMDPLRDATEALAERLRATGVQVTAKRFENLPHGFDLFLIDKRAKAATLETCGALRELLAA